MVGTASTVRSWLLLEDPGPWGRDALRDARLPRGIGPDLLRRCRVAGVRPLLIRRARTGELAAPDDGVACFAIRSGPEPPWIERVRLGGVSDALDLDLRALGRGERLGYPQQEEPIFLVCTHGRRDVCCAERGRPLAHALTAAYPEQTWESSHLGGDRFAGNLVAFPHGLYFGRVRAEDGADVARAYTEGMVPLDHLRGRSCHPMPVQAAEHALRVREGLVGVDDVSLEQAEQRDGVVTASFETPSGRFVVAIEMDRSEPSFLTCQSRLEERAPTYRVLQVVPSHP